MILVLNKIRAELLIHPLSVQEIRRDRNKKRQAVMLSKIGAYPVLEMPPTPDNDHEFLKIIGCKNDAHDLIDNNLLYAIQKDAVDFLLTEDRDIHKKAVRVGIDSRVLLIAEALLLFRAHLQKDSVVTPPALSRKPVHSLDTNDPFFDSLKEEYQEFENWFRKVKREGRECLVSYKDDGGIGALLIYKFEEELVDAVPRNLPKKRRVKLSTFKVEQLGYKIGELFIKLSIDIALKDDVYEIYLTHFVRPEDRLVELITEYGFYSVGTNSRGEGVFVKRLIPELIRAKGLSPFDITRVFYPSFYDGAKVKKFIIPIRPLYHGRLFTNYKDRQTELQEMFFYIVEGNTIKKAYVCNSRIRNVSQGDIILFYVSERKKLITLGVVETVYRGLQHSSDIVKAVGKRTVYSMNEIDSISIKPSLVILFWQYWHLDHPLSYYQLIDMGILKGPPRSIVRIPDQHYYLIKETGRINARFTVN
ncbi:MAG: hypothetical protein IBX68_08680 [Dehalococcoidia bacterium]|nr:hypothetical protein [Dehalococcoidia bacterium]